VKSCDDNAILGGYEDSRAEALQPGCQIANASLALDSVTGEQQLPSSQSIELIGRVTCIRLVQWRADIR
jgi:hypothetical protein